MKLLVISLAGIGDTILATPLIHELRANFPDARIEALVRWVPSKDILEGNPHVDAVHQRDLTTLSKSQALRFLRSLGRNGYDVSINTHPQSRIHYRLTARLVGARTRISHAYECSGWLDRWLVNRSLPQDYQQHTVENNLAVLPLLGKKPLLADHRLELFLTAAEHKWAENFIAHQGLAHRLRLGVHAGSGETKNLSLKRWPFEHYTELLKRVCRAWPDLAVLLFGGPNEEAEIQSMSKAIGSPRVLRAQTPTLRQAGALMQRCTAFLSVDTALMHVAAAVQAPRQIVIEAPTLNKTNEPYGNAFVLVRNPAIAGRNLEYYRYDGLGIKGTRDELLHCMASVSVEAVYAELAKALAGGPHS
jgi:lipopolysaccharide heptosyltransferase II